MDGSKNILVTGSTGFIGRRITARLKELGHTVHPFARSLGHDVCDKESFAPFAHKGIDTVIHLAGATFVPDSWNAPASFYTVNTLGTQCALDFCRQARAKMLYVSAYVYGTPAYLPIDEAHPIAPNNPYAHSKWLAEELCRFYAEQMGVKTVILRPFNLYGAGQDSRFLIPMLVRQMRENGKIVVKDDAPRRDYLHVSDFVEACLAALQSDADFRLYNVGSGHSLSVREIVETIRAAHPGDATWHSLGEKRHNEIPDTVAGCSAIKRELDWLPKVEFKDGVRELMHSEFSPNGVRP